MKQPRIIWTFRIALPVAAFFAAAGGLGLAAISGLTAIFAITPKALFRALARPALPLILIAAAIAWTCLSLIWSPHDKPDQAIKLALLTPLYLALPFIAAQLDEAGRAQVRPLIIAAATASLLFLVIEAAFQAPTTVRYKIDVESFDADFATILAYAHRLLSRGTVFALLLAGPAIMLLWRAGSQPTRTGAICLFILALIAASGFSVEANLIALLIALGLSGLALRFPARTLQGLIVLTAAVLMLAPFLFTAAFSVLPDSFRDPLPLSWAWRLEIWDHTLGMIAERPLTGHGLDVARAEDTTAMLRGIEIELLPLHAHNALLNIWVETGFVGALIWACALLGLAVWLSRRALERDLCVLLVYVGTVWLVSVLLGIGIWQEWHHGALSLAVASAVLSVSPALAGNLRRSG